MKASARVLAFALLFTSLNAFAETKTHLTTIPCGVNEDIVPSSLRFMANAQGEVSAAINLIHWHGTASPIATESGPGASTVYTERLAFFEVRGETVVNTQTGNIVGQLKKNILAKPSFKLTKAGSIDATERMVDRTCVMDLSLIEK